MITLEVDKSVNLKCGQSIYVSFPYNEGIVDLLSAIPLKVFIPQDKEWEIHKKYFSTLLDLFAEYDLEIVGDLPPSMEKELLRMQKFEDENNTEFKFKTKPLSYQIESFDFAQSNSKFILGDEQGLGKTKQAIDIAVARKHKFSYCLIVCCVSGLQWNWKNEIAKHSNEKCYIVGEHLTRTGNVYLQDMNKRYEDLQEQHSEFFIITNIDTVKNKLIGSLLKEMCTSGDIGMVVIDEIHKCANPTSKLGESIHNLCSYYRMAMTGTPLINSPIDLYNILKWVDKEHHNLTQFKSYYCISGGYGNYEIVGYKHLDELSKVLDSAMLRRKKADVLDLPEKVYRDEYIIMDSKQKKLYKDVTLLIKEDVDKVALNYLPLAKLTRLRQVTSYPGIISSTITSSAKFERALEIVEECILNADKVIVFSVWADVIKPFYEIVKKKYGCELITGEIDNRQQCVDNFQENDSCKVMCGTIGALGTGFTLTAASTVIFLDEPFTKANKMQAEDRAHRIGTKKTVTVVTLLCQNTVDDWVHDIVYQKGIMTDVIVDKQNIESIDMSSVKLLLSM